MSVCIEGLRHLGESCLFEYHCFESHESADAQLWYRSHKPVRVLRIAQNDGYDPADASLTPTASWNERAEAGTPIVYTVVFADGFKGDAFEDELVDNISEFFRPDPPKERT